MTAAPRWRCFVAVEIGDGLRTALAAHVGAWRSRPDLAGLRWSDPAAWHVTLAFIGAVEPERVGDLEQAMGLVAGAHERRDVPTGGLGAFPRPGRARVAWYGIGDPDGRLEAIAADLARELALEATGPYRPHLTLARARSEPVDVRAWLGEAAASAPDDRLDVSSLLLVRSHLGSGPARYETLARVSLR